MRCQGKSQEAGQSLCCSEQDFHSVLREARTTADRQHSGQNSKQTRVQMKVREAKTRLRKPGAGHCEHSLEGAAEPRHCPFHSAHSAWQWRAGGGAERETRITCWQACRAFLHELAGKLLSSLSSQHTGKERISHWVPGTWVMFCPPAFR